MHPRGEYIKKTFGDVFGQDADLIISVILKIDPTPNKAYAVWFARQWKALNADENVVSPTDEITKAAPLIAAFQKLKSAGYFKLPNANGDINHYTIQTLSDLIVCAYKEIETAEGFRYDPSIESFLFGIKEAVCVEEDDDARFILLNSFDASRYFGCDTEWCTSYSQEDFREYNDAGSLIVIIDKHTNNRWQIFIPKHTFGVVQFLDSDNEVVEFDPRHKALFKLADLLRRKDGILSVQKKNRPSVLRLYGADYSKPSNLAKVIPLIENDEWVIERIGNLKKINRRLVKALWVVNFDIHDIALPKHKLTKRAKQMIKRTWSLEKLGLTE